MIDERMQEQASLYVLGVLDGKELREFELILRSNPELLQFIAKLNLSAEALAHSVAILNPPPHLRAKVLAQIKTPQKVVSLSPQKYRSFFGLSWSLVTGLAALCLILSVKNNQLLNQIGTQSQQINELNQVAQILQSTTNNLQQSVLALQEMNRLANLKIAMLNSMVTDTPKAMAVSLWDTEKQNGVFVAENLKPLSSDKDYQLWVLEDGKTPVDAGVFHVSKDGTARTEFKAKQPIKIAGKFAVTQEIKGGVASPTLKNMVLLGNSL